MTIGYIMQFLIENRVNGNPKVKVIIANATYAIIYSIHGDKTEFSLFVIKSLKNDKDKKSILECRLYKSH